MAKKPAKPTAKTKKPAKKVPHLYRERHPEKHDLTGKYTFLYLFFAACTLIFALTTMYVYSLAQDITRRYDKFVENHIKEEARLEEKCEELRKSKETTNE